MANNNEIRTEAVTQALGLEYNPPVVQTVGGKEFLVYTLKGTDREIVAAIKSRLEQSIPVVKTEHIQKLRADEAKLRSQADALKAEADRLSV